MYSFSSRIRYSEVDESSTLSILALLNYLQDCSLFQTEALGHGPAHVEEVGLRWLLSTWQIEIDRLPRFCETVTVSTWACEFKGLFASRDFTMVDEQGASLVRANSQWFMFDDALGRPIRPPESELAAYADDIANDRPLPIEHMGRKIAVPQGGADAEPVAVTRAHIDTNHHVNNAQYVGMALDVLPRGLAVRNLDVQYIAAAHLGDTLYPRVCELDGGQAAPGHEEPATAPASDRAAGYVVALNDAAGKPYAIVRIR